MATINPFDVFLEPDATHFPSPTIRFSTRKLGPFRKLLPAGLLFSAFLATIPRERRRGVA
jgi:hypothetical protein